MKTLILVLTIMASTVTFAADKEKEKEKQCNTYCNSVNMDGTGGQICQTVCS